MGSEDRRRSGGVRRRSKQDAAEKAVFCELSSHYWGFGKALRMTALGTFFISLALFLVNLLSKHVSAWLTRKVKSLQTNNMAICSSGIAGFSLFPQLLPSQRGNDRLCHGYRAWLWLVGRLSTISIRNPTAAGLITVS